MWMQRLVAAIGFLLLIGLTPVFAQDLPLFEESDCPGEARLPAAFECGYLTVALDRSQPDSPTLRLMVAVYRSPGEEVKADPVIYLSGGPGGASVIGATRVMRVFGNFSQRDIIFFDQRGTGYSDPDMTCPEIDAAFYAGMEQQLNWDERAAQGIQAARDCHDRLVAEGINPAFFNSAASAADVDDLRRALGYEQVNLYGVSYGTRLALTIMRDHPDGIRSAILDSVYPPNVDGFLEGVPKLQMIFDKVFAACAADEFCNQKYPDLQDIFYQVVDQMNAEPVTVKAQPQALIVDGNGLMSGLFGWLYDASVISDVPRLIYELRDGETGGLSSLVPLLSPFPNYSVGMSYSVQCQEEFPFIDTAALDKPMDGLNPLMQDLIQKGHQIDQKICGLWDAGTADALENQAVVSDIPTLLLAGEYDPITPPSYAELAAETLSNSHYFLVPKTAHGVLFGHVGFCAVLIARDFLDDPAQTPESTCPTEMPLTFE